MLMAGLRRAVPCADCGGTFPTICMDFDHRPGAEKKADVAVFVGNGNWRRAFDEIAKCDTVCANCHRVRTQERGQARRRTIAPGP